MLKIKSSWKMINNKWKVNNWNKKERVNNMMKTSNKVDKKMNKLKKNKDNKDNKDKDNNNKMK